MSEVRDVAWADILTSLDELIRSGKLVEARERMDQIVIREVPEAHRATLGKLFIRVNLPQKTLLCLNRQVHLGNKINPNASLEEKLTYALGLVRLGLASEAREILFSLPDDCADARLYRAFMYQTLWEYPSAIPHLDAYLTLKKFTPYERAVAEVNLVACLIQDRQYERANSILEKLITDSENNNWNLLFRNSCELAVQSAVEQEQWARAREILARIPVDHEKIESPADLFVAKWAVFTDALENPSKQNQMRVHNISVEAKRLEHWETVRDCDRVLAKITNDTSLFSHVYFGTPFRFFREKMVSRDMAGHKAPENYILGSSQGRVFDLKMAKTEDGEASLRPGHIVHRTLTYLLEDFYRPTSLGRLHFRLFPGEYFNPESSPGRIATLIHRTRAWLKANDLPMEIEADQRSFRIRITGHDFGVRFTRLVEVSESSKMDISGFIDRIHSKISDRPFTCDEVAKTLEVSRSAAVRILKSAIAEGLIRREGKGRSTLYVWGSNATKNAA